MSAKQICCYLTEINHVPGFDAMFIQKAPYDEPPRWNDYVDEFRLPDEANWHDQYHVVDCGEVVVHILARGGPWSLDFLQSLGEGYVDGTLPVQKFDLSKFDHCPPGHWEMQKNGNEIWMKD